MPAEPLDPKRSTLLSVMFADIAGSTRLYETLGDASASRIVETCIEHMDGATRLNGGTTVKWSATKPYPPFLTRSWVFRPPSR